MADGLLLSNSGNKNNSLRSIEHFSLGGSNIITFWSRGIENAYVIMYFLFQIFCDDKIQLILQETNALKVAEMLPDFLHLCKKQTN